MDTMDDLFKEYEESFAKLDFKSIAKLYGDSFISAGPKGTISNSKQDFINKAGEFAEYHKKVGMTSARKLSCYELSISNEYSLVTVHWGVTFEKLGNQKVEFDVTYIVQKTGNEPKIIMFISHEDEAEAMKRVNGEWSMVNGEST